MHVQGKYGMVVTEGLLVYTTYIPDMSTLDVSSSLLVRHLSGM